MVTVYLPNYERKNLVIMGLIFFGVFCGDNVGIFIGYDYGKYSAHKQKSIQLDVLFHKIFIGAVWLN